MEDKNKRMTNRHAATNIYGKFGDVSLFFSGDQEQKLQTDLKKNSVEKETKNQVRKIFQLFHL